MTQALADVRATARSQIRQSDVLPRVLLSICHFYPDGGGAEVQAYRLAGRLVQRGVPLTVLTGRYGGRPRVETIDRVLVRRHFIGAYVPVFHVLCYLASLAWELVARRHEYDVVHLFQTQLSTFVAMVIAKRLGKRVITRSCNTGQFGDMAYWSSVPGGTRMLEYVRANVDAAIGVSKETMAELHQAGFDPRITWHIPNGVAVPPSDARNRSALRVRLGLAPGAFIAVFVGRLVLRKAPELLLDAWMSIQNKYPDAQLVLLGDGEQRTTLEAKVRQADLIREVMFAGQVDNVDEYLGAADVFVLPSLTEGLSNALLEAMAAGLPVVASRVSGTVDVVQHGENGLLFEPGDTEGLADCLAYLIESPQRQAELGRKARKTVEERFSLDAAADRHLALYQSLLTAN